MLVGEQYQQMIMLNYINNSFEKSKNFHSIDQSVIENSFKCFQLSNFKKSDVVLQNGFNIMTKLILVAEGRLVNVFLLLT